MLSALSMKVPMREKLKISFLSIVPWKAPRISPARRLIVSMISGMSVVFALLARIPFISIQHSLIASHVSRVSAVRTMRALLRPASMHDITLDGLARSRRRKSIASPLVNPSWIWS